MKIEINSNWTLFLDRDGVLNKEKSNNYILNWDEFLFYDGVKEALKILNPLFKTIVVVTNQRGVGKNLMTLNDLNLIHENLKTEIENSGGRIDKFYFCTDIENTSQNRKPNPGMALQAKQDFQHINFSQSIMVGNKLSDMEFARNVGMKSVFVATTHPETTFPHSFIDYRFNDLLAFAEALKKS